MSRPSWRVPTGCEPRGDPAGDHLDGAVGSELVSGFFPARGVASSPSDPSTRPASVRRGRRRSPWRALRPPRPAPPGLFGGRANAGLGELALISLALTTRGGRPPRSSGLRCGEHGGQRGGDRRWRRRDRGRSAGTSASGAKSCSTPRRRTLVPSPVSGSSARRACCPTAASALPATARHHETYREGRGQLRDRDRPVCATSPRCRDLRTAGARGVRAGPGVSGAVPLPSSRTNSVRPDARRGFGTSRRERFACPIGVTELLSIRGQR